MGNPEAMEFADMEMDALLAPGGHACGCGRTHATDTRIVKIGSNALSVLPGALSALGCRRAFVVCDLNTFDAAGECVLGLLREGGIAHRLFVFPTRELILPDEASIQRLREAFDGGCDFVLGVGGGVINDLCKLLARERGLPCGIVATAPSMDGIASDSSAMEIAGVKTTVYVRAPALVVCDTGVMARAPMEMLRSGLGDMLAKYVSICEWRLAHLITGEYFCGRVADMMRASVAKIVLHADRIAARDERAVAAVAEGLVLSGIAMAFAGVSRPASGLEHCFSHIWEMMALERGGSHRPHGIQVGVGTLLALRVYGELRALQPDPRWVQGAEAFDPAAWEANVRRVFGSAARAIIDNAAGTGINDQAARRARASMIAEHWDDVLSIIDEELSPSDAIRALMQAAGLPVSAAEIGISNRDARDAFVCSRDIRDRYLSSSMLWDVGELGAVADKVFG